jgi:hypothetical protein
LLKSDKKMFYVVMEALKQYIIEQVKEGNPDFNSGKLRDLYVNRKTESPQQ